MKKITGWLTPARKFIECEAWDHMATLQSVLGADWFTADVAASADDYRQRGYCDSGPEWHSYDDSLDNEQDVVRKRLSDEGYIRIGTLGKTIHYEGRRDHLAARKQELIDFAEGYGMDYELEPIEA